MACETMPAIQIQSRSPRNMHRSSSVTDFVVTESTAERNFGKFIVILLRNCECGLEILSKKLMGRSVFVRTDSQRDLVPFRRIAAQPWYVFLYPDNEKKTLQFTIPCPRNYYTSFSFLSDEPNISKV